MGVIGTLPTCSTTVFGSSTVTAWKFLTEATVTRPDASEGRPSSRVLVATGAGFLFFSFGVQGSGAIDEVSRRVGNAPPKFMEKQFLAGSQSGFLFSIFVTNETTGP